jgi:hypothetical protein
MNMNTYRTQINGSLKQGFAVALNHDSAARVTVNSDYSSLTCDVCGGENCPHRQALREVGFYPTQLVLDELWLHTLPALPDGYTYTTVRYSVWHVPTIETYRNPRHYHQSARVGGLHEVMLTSDGEMIATLFVRRDIYQRAGETVTCGTEVLVPHASAAEVARIIANTAPRQGG